jgi:ribonuclease BN (tRNA processing enzyme)
MGRPRRSGFAALLLALSHQASAAEGQVPAAAPPASTGTRVVVLGTGTPNPDPDRSGPAVAVVVDGTAYLVDAGAGVMRRAESARRQGIDALAADRLGIVFLTHLHSDHTIGLPDVIQTGWVLERTTPLRVFGPPGTVAMTGHLTAAWAADLDNRRNGTQPHTPEGWKVDARDIEGGVVYKDSSVTVTAIPVIHAGWPAAFAYRFVTRDRVIVISGDTRPTEAVADACNGCDVLVHEVYSARGFAGRPPAWKVYHAGAHTSTSELATLAARARPRLLVLYHQLYWGTTDDQLLAEIAAGYKGPVVSARDLGIY